MNLLQMIREAMNKMETLQNKAKAETRDLSDEEKVVFENLAKEVENNQKALDREKRPHDLSYG